jgi:hypothetical protein
MTNLRRHSGRLHGQLQDEPGIPRGAQVAPVEPGVEAWHVYGTNGRAYRRGTLDPKASGATKWAPETRILGWSGRRESNPHDTSLEGRCRNPLTRSDVPAGLPGLSDRKWP